MEAATAAHDKYASHIRKGRRGGVTFLCDAAKAALSILVVGRMLGGRGARTLPDLPVL